MNGTEIAIIGMAGRFPGAANIDAFWCNLRDGVESITFLTDEELAARGVDQATRRDPSFVKAVAALDDVEAFDAPFFGINPREAELIDPQHRFFLECAWEALESAGCDPETYQGLISVYGGATINTYLLFHVAANPALLRATDPLQINIGNGGDFLTTRVSYKLNLKGPSHLVQSACSTSLVAVHIACQSLLSEECDLALAGGVSINLSLRNGYAYLEGGMASPDGRCRAFDAQAQGTIFGSGVGVVVLKRLRDALADGDTIHALIKGSAINNDGALKVGYTAPSVDGQAEVIAEALANAGVAPETIGYVETHGTGTPLGDPIEVQALTRAFRAGTDRAGFCAIGSVKTNIGHLDAAAGVTGLIKAVLALEHGLIPPSLHFETPNPNIDFASSPFYVNTALSEWPAGATPRRAGVSAFGVGGTNAHVVLEEAPPPAPTTASRPWQLLLLSARTATALETATADLVQYLEQHPEHDLADVAYTLQAGRRALSHRRALVCRNRADALAALALPDQHTLGGVHEAGEQQVVFLFPGQGAQYVNMARGLYESEPAFREHVDHCAELLLPHLGLDLREVLYPEEQRTQNKEQNREYHPGEPRTKNQEPGTNDHRPPTIDLRPTSDPTRPFTPSPFHPFTPSPLPSPPNTQHPTPNTLDQTWLTQPALFVVEYALARLWMEWGVRPVALIGHSIGEYVAACLAGVFSLEDALALVAARGKLMQQLPAGAMLAVPLPEEEVGYMLGQQLSLAAVNGLSQCVVSGPADAVAALEQQLAQEGLVCRRLPAAHAFHSQMMDPIVGAFVERVRQVALGQPQIPFVSNVSGAWITAAEATDPRYWGRHLRQPVRFGDGIGALLRGPARIVLEVGPGQSLSRLVRRHPAATPQYLALASLPQRDDQQPDAAALLTALGRLWLAGARVDWAGVYARERHRRLPLPTYPFERQRYWIEPAAPEGDSEQRHASAGKRPDIADWFYIPSWKRSLPPAPDDAAVERRRWLVFVDRCGLGHELARGLEQSGDDVVRVAAGERFGRAGARDFTIDPRARQDYTALLGELRAPDQALLNIAHLWSITPQSQAQPDAAAFEQAQVEGFYSLLCLAQALASEEPAGARLAVVSNQLHSIVYDEAAWPEKATIGAACKVIPQEYPQISCRSIDIVPPEPGTWRATALADQLIAEIGASSLDGTVAYRGDQRWVQTYEAVRQDRPADAGALLRENGTYMIIGGLAGIGFALAEYLARAARARLVVVEDAPFPDRERWDDWIAAHDERDHVSRNIRNARALEAAAEVLVCGAAIADADQVRAVVARAVERFGAIHGVVYAASLPGDQSFLPIQEISPITGELPLAPCVSGALALASALRVYEPDFCLLVSSLASVLGGPGAATYTAASLFLDALAQEQNRTGRARWISVNWDAWRFPEEHAHGAFAMTPDEGMETFRRLGALGRVGQVIVSTGDLAARIEQWLNRKPPHDLAQPQHDAAPALLHPRPQLRNAYVAPESETERMIAAIWQDALGIAQVGATDNFFDLGGDSLVAIQTVARLKNVLDIDIPVSSLYEGLTVRSLIGVLGLDQPEAGSAQPDGGSVDGRAERISRKKHYQQQQRSRRRT